MFTLKEWNWGLYVTQYKTLEEAEYAYIQAAQVADINRHPDPELFDAHGNKIH